MVALINKATKTKMWVAENRVEEYKAAGHSLAAENIDVVPPVVEKPKRSRKERK